MHYLNGEGKTEMTEARKKFKAIGIASGAISGLMYGLYTTFVLIAGYYEPLAGAVGIFAAPYVTSGLNDFFAGLWLTAYNIKNGKIREIGRSLKLFPGKIILPWFFGRRTDCQWCLSDGLAMAGGLCDSDFCNVHSFRSIVCTGLLKQKIVPRVGLGMVICVAGAIVINWVRPEGSTNFTLGMICAFVAAIGWALEGVFAAYGSAMLDTDVVINIRQLLSGIVDLIVILPIVGGMGLLKGTLLFMPPVAWLVVSGLCAAISYLLWYKSNCTVGCAMGMSLNITYAFWGVLFCILFIKQPVTPTIIIGSIIIIIGAVLVSVDPFELLSKKEELTNEV